MTRPLYALLAAVALAAAVLSFDALRDLALLCGFSRSLAWLLPVVVDAGAAAGSLVWLGGWAPAVARRFARRLALVLLGSSVAANALSHGLAAYGMAPAWWVVVLVSGVAPAVLGAVVHLVVVAHRADLGDELAGEQPSDTEDAPEPPADTPTPGDEPGDPGDAVGEPGDDPPDRVGELVAAGAGWVTVGRELGLNEYQAKKWLKAHRNGHRVDAG